MNRVIGRTELLLSELAERRHMRDDVPLSSPNNGIQHYRMLTGPSLTLAASHRLFSLKNNPDMLSRSLLASVQGTEIGTQDLKALGNSRRQVCVATMRSLRRSFLFISIHACFVL
jgi:hypothetical protein